MMLGRWNAFSRESYDAATGSYELVGNGGHGGDGLDETDPNYNSHKDIGIVPAAPNNGADAAGCFCPVSDPYPDTHGGTQSSFELPTPCSIWLAMDDFMSPYAFTELSGCGLFALSLMSNFP